MEKCTKIYNARAGPLFFSLNPIVLGRSRCRCHSSFLEQKAWDNESYIFYLFIPNLVMGTVSKSNAHDAISKSLGHFVPGFMTHKFRQAEFHAACRRDKIWSLQESLCPYYSVQGRCPLECPDLEGGHTHGHVLQVACHKYT